MTNTHQHPLKKDGTRICIAVTTQGVTVYGNKAAFESFAELFAWLASSPAPEHYELHTIMSLQDEASKFEGKRVKNVYALFDKRTQVAFEQETEDCFGFELTFMMTTESDLNKLDLLQGQGPLPENWHSENEK